MLTERIDDVFLIEQQNELGGLLRSRTNSTGHTFDTGTHFLVPTNIPGANKLLFEDLSYNNCYQFTDSLLEGNYFNGVLNQESGSIDTRTLSPDIHARGLVELLNAVPDSGSNANLEQKLKGTYGPTFTNHVFEPVIRSLTGRGLADLHPTAHLSFLITRLIVLESRASIEIKKSEFFDSKIAWTRNIDGESGTLKLYPKSGGVGTWILGLENRIRKMGVNVITGTKVNSIKRNLQVCICCRLFTQLDISSVSIKRNIQ